MDNLNEALVIKEGLEKTSIIAVTDSQGVITYVNEEFCKISGFVSKELVGKTHRLINSGFHSKDFFKSMWSTISSGEVWRGEIKNRDKNGHQYWVDTTIIPVMNPDNEPLKYISIRNVITPKKLMSEVMKALVSASYLEGSKLYENVILEVARVLEIHSAIFSLKTENNNFKTEVFVLNGKVSKPITYNLKDNPCLKTIQGEGVYIENDLQKVYPECDFANEHTLKSYVGIPIKNNSGELQGILCFFDTKEIKYTELFTQIVNLIASRLKDEMNRLVAREELNTQTLFNQRLSALAAMAGGIAHELNQPLSGIRIYAEMINNLVEGDKEVDKIKISTTIEKVIKQVHRASKIIDHMRAFSSDKTDQQLDCEIISLKDCIESSLELIGQQLKNNGITFINEVDSDHKIKVNLHRLEQVLINLFSNAKDSINDKSFRIGEDKFIHVSSFRSASKVELIIRDTGEGIPESVRNSLFEPFVSSKIPGKGSGLGLPICIGILRDFDATIELVSTSEEGTTFKIEFTGV